MKKVWISLLVLIAVAVIVINTFVVKNVDQSKNRVLAHEPFSISTQAEKLHASLIVGDWHADTALWNRDMQGRHSFGHLDLARMQEGNIALQMFTTVTKSPSGQNYESNETSASDNITPLVMAQLWPISAWTSLTERALYQAKRVNDLAKRRPQDFMVVSSKSDLAKWQQERESNADFVAGLIGTEGSHALDGDLENIEVLYNAGFRMMSLQHFFDNALGGSLHGTTQTGLTNIYKCLRELIHF